MFRDRPAHADRRARPRQPVAVFPKPKPASRKVCEVLGGALRTSAGARQCRSASRMIFGGSHSLARQVGVVSVGVQSAYALGRG